MTFAEYFKKWCEDDGLDVWNMSREEYNYHKNWAKRYWEMEENNKKGNE